MIDPLSPLATADSQSIRRIDLKEWESQQVLLTAEEAFHLLGCPSNVLKMQAAARGYTKLQTAAIVGQLRLGSMELRILPKYPMPSLMAMLAEVHDLAHLMPQLAGYDRSPDIADLLVQIFLHQTDQVIRKGLKRSYVQEDDELVALRGRIDIRQSVGLHLRGRTVLQCRFEEYTLDGVENRLLRKTLQRIAACRTIRLSHRNLAHQMASEFVGVRTDGWEPPKSWQFTTDRLSRHYLPALPLAKLILDGMGIAHDFGMVEGDGFLLNMNRVFESFVCRRLKGMLSTRGVRTREQHRCAFDKEHRAEIKPDLIAQAPAGRQVVVDTKYKTSGEPAPADLYQMLAYCRVLSIANGVLVTVGTGERESLEVSDGTTTIEIIPVDLNGTIENIDHSLLNLSERLLELLEVAAIG